MADVGDIIIADDHVEVRGGLQVSGSGAALQVTGESYVLGPNGSLKVDQVLTAESGIFNRIDVGTRLSIGQGGFVLYSQQNVPFRAYNQATLQQVMAQCGIDGQKTQTFINTVFSGVPMWTAPDIAQTYLLISAEKISIVTYHLTGLAQIYPGQPPVPTAVSIIPGSDTSSVDLITFDAKNGTVKIAGLSH